MSNAQLEPNNVLKQQLQTHLSHVVRERDPYLATVGHFYVQQYIKQQLAQWGAVQVHEFSSQGAQHQNLILDLPGQRSNLSPILVGAHYDAFPGSPGADDNATGVAVLLELARSFSLNPPKRPIRLIAFDFEETIYDLAGSTHYAQSLQREPLRLMLSLEMLGYCSRVTGSQIYPTGLQRFFPKQGDFIGLIGNLPSLLDLIHLSHHIRKAGIPCQWLPAGWRGEILPDTRRSDHAAFWDLGYRALMVTDTAHLRNPHYHKASDRLETLNLDFLTGICHGLAEGLRRL